MSLDGREFKLLSVSYCYDFCLLEITICMRYDMREPYDTRKGLRITRQMHHWDIVLFKGCPEKTKTWEFECKLLIPKWEKQDYQEHLKHKQRRIE